MVEKHNFFYLLCTIAYLHLQSEAAAENLSSPLSPSFGRLFFLEI